MECWVATHAPVLRSAIPTARLASEIFLTNLHFVFKNEVMEYWNIGVVFRNFQHSITPTLQHSSTPLLATAHRIDLPTPALPDTLASHKRVQPESD